MMFTDDHGNVAGTNFSGQLSVKNDISLDERWLGTFDLLVVPAVEM